MSVFDNYVEDLRINPSAPVSGYGEWCSSISGMKAKMLADGIVRWYDNVIISSIVAASAAIANTDTKIDAGLLLSANEFTAGTDTDIDIFGTCTVSSAGAQVFSVRFGALNTKADALICTVSLTSASSGTAIPFHLKIHLTVRTIGAAGTIYGWFELLNGDGATTGVYTKVSSSQAVGGIATLNTTASGYLGISYISGHASCACTFQNVVIKVTKQ
jgi:hypothetical protein